MLSPLRYSKPDAPVDVDRTGKPAAHASRILMRVPDPQSIGTIARSAARRYGSTVSTLPTICTFVGTCKEGGLEPTRRNATSGQLGAMTWQIDCTAARLGG